MKVYIERGKRSETVMVEDAEQMDILPGNFRNFRGEKRKNPKNGKIVNDEGVRNFNLALNLPVEALDDLAALGLNIRQTVPNEEYGDEPLRFVKVNIKYDSKIPPELYLCTDTKKKLLNQSELGLLDGARFKNVGLVMNVHHNEDSNSTLYLNKGFFVIQQDPISAKFENLAMDEVGTMIDDEEDPPFNEN